MRPQLIVLCLAASALGACSGGGGGGGGSTLPSSPSGGGTPTTTQSTNEQAVAAANGVGTPVKNFSSYEQSVSTKGTLANKRVALSAANGVCASGVEFFSPDTAGDPSSTESKLFYDASCTDLARDVVRVVTQSTASSESVTRTETLYVPNNATPIATRTSTDAIANATFDAYFFPIAADGFTRSATSQLAFDGSRLNASADELVVQPSSNGTNGFCGDSAGYSVTGSTKLGETFGWAGGVLSGGTRTVNSDGSVTWTATHAGTGYKAPIGSLALATGTANTTCPIATPADTLTGGTAVGTYSIPVVATYLGGRLVSLSIANATLSNGNTLNVSTTAGASPQSSTFVTGTISQGATQVATFAVDAFGDGTLTVTKTGAQFVITDWHVVR